MRSLQENKKEEEGLTMTEYHDKNQNEKAEKVQRPLCVAVHVPTLAHMIDDLSRPVHSLRTIVHQGKPPTRFSAVFQKSNRYMMFTSLSSRVE